MPGRVVGVDGELQAQQLRPVVGPVDDRGHHRATDALALRMLRHRHADARRVAASDRRQRMHAGVADDFATAFGNDEQLGRHRPDRHLVDALLPRCLGRIGELQQAGQHIRVTHDRDHRRRVVETRAANRDRRSQRRAAPKPTRPRRRAAASLCRRQGALFRRVHRPTPPPTPMPSASPLHRCRRPSPCRPCHRPCRRLAGRRS